MVPHEPAPITATFVVMMASLGEVSSTLAAVTHSIAVLIPVKSFADAKHRLAEVMGANDRAALARNMAETVIAAAAPLPVTVVCDDQQVADWATAQGAAVVWADQPGLNAAVQCGVTALAAQGVARVVVAHGDLPRATQLAPCAEFAGVTLVPDRHNDGTPVAVVPAEAGFVFAYGPGSYAKHVAEAERLGLPWRSLRDPDLGHDVDEPDDLEGAGL